MKEITQRELRNDSGAIMRGLDAGETFLVTRNGVAVGELVPIRRSRFVRSDLLVELFFGGLLALLIVVLGIRWRWKNRDKDPGPGK